jgi:two-component system, OmpR family, response regulator
MLITPISTILPLGAVPLQPIPSAGRITRHVRTTRGRVPLDAGTRAGDEAVTQDSNPPLSVRVAEDCQDTAATTAELLEAHGHFVRVASRGQDALAEVEADPPDLVLLDIGLPGMSGWEVAERLRETRQKRPVVVAVSGFGSEADLERSARAGIDLHLTKPVEPATLALFLKRIGISLGTRGGAPSGQEEHVLRLVAVGRSDRDVAESSGQSVQEVESLKARAMRRLRLHTQADVIRYAAGRGWLSRPDGDSTPDLDRGRGVFHLTLAAHEKTGGRPEAVAQSTSKRNPPVEGESTRRGMRWQENSSRFSSLHEATPPASKLRSRFGSSVRSGSDGEKDLVRAVIARRHPVPVVGVTDADPGTRGEPAE